MVRTAQKIGGSLGVLHAVHTLIVDNVATSQFIDVKIYLIDVDRLDGESHLAEVFFDFLHFRRIRRHDDFDGAGGVEERLDVAARIANS